MNSYRFRSALVLLVVFLTAAMPILGCDACVEDVYGRKFCKDSTVYQSFWPRYAGCEAWQYCYHEPGFEESCSWYCDGTPCFEV